MMLCQHSKCQQSIMKRLACLFQRATSGIKKLFTYLYYLDCNTIFIAQKCLLVNKSTRGSSYGILGIGKAIDGNRQI